ncbi:ABC transporter ATP-binding protein [Phytoactinopolyspora halotolerans]|uniref:ABC transporter ATP-binding protein n=1 Tax=Phytoactinopolyspora halotolerans TaxID=1981512 RepID=A0A6L9S9Y6_9ACTN|nr:ABC transporter ATP-binding protein [Phytoactinopolyspora halotolerans]NEE02056.1 ABC transporter ATP-binding protein [Phytoactinopolyspora halotolerans]
MEAAITITGLTVDRGKKEVLHEISTEVDRGVITGLLGPSGSGKTTLMRAIVGVQLVKAGSVTVLGRPAGSASLRQSVGYLTQSPSIYQDLTVWENVRHFASLYGLGDEEAEQTISDVGLGEQSGQLARDLSGGQSSRASLACALVGRPEVLILDEPTVGQDPVLRDDLWRRFRKFADEGVTLMVSSHVMDEANRCDRLLLIRDGRIIADDTPAAVKEAAGTNDLDQAFLTLVRERDEGEAA